MCQRECGHTFTPQWMREDPGGIKEALGSSRARLKPRGSESRGHLKCFAGRARDLRTRESSGERYESEKDLSWRPSRRIWTMYALCMWGLLEQPLISMPEVVPSTYCTSKAMLNDIHWCFLRRLTHHPTPPFLTDKVLAPLFPCD